MKDKLLDKDTIDAYHAYVQSGIRSDLNAISLGPGRFPSRLAQFVAGFGFVCFFIGILLVALRMRHVYFWDWNAQFVGPVFFIMFLLCMGGATYLALVATRRSNRFRRELYFHPLGDYGISAVHKEDLLHEQELKNDLKSGTTPHKSVMPHSEAYSQSNIDRRSHRGHNNQAYRHGPGDQYRDRRPQDGRRGPPGDEKRRGPPPDDRRRGPPPDDRRRGPPPDDRRRGPPPDDRRRGPPPDDRRRGPPPDDRRRGPPPDDRRRGPPDERPRGPPDDRRGPPPNEQRGPPPNGQRRPPQGERIPREGGSPPEGRGRQSPPPKGYSNDDRRGPQDDDRHQQPSEDRRPRGVPRFLDKSPVAAPGMVKLDVGKDSESEL